MAMSSLAVLLMAYGTPSSEDDIETYLTDIQGGRKPTAQAVEDLRARYRKIGGKSPLLEITQAQAAALERVLSSQGIGARVYVAMKHWHPYIREVVPQIAQNGCRRLIGLVLAPHYSYISTGGYRQAFDEAVASTSILQVDFVESWHDHSGFHAALAEKIQQGLQYFPQSTRDSVQILFTAHSLPERILEKNDPYSQQLRTSCQSVANLLRLDRWSFAYQSAGHTSEKWLKPDILEFLEEFSGREGGRDVLVVPIGFVADHLEVLYDIDIKAQSVAQARRINLRRTESLNTSPKFIEALADIVCRQLQLDAARPTPA